MEEKFNDWENMKINIMDQDTIRLREEISMQYRALKEIKEMAATYGFDISNPAKNAKEAVQWTYFGYLAAIKENNGAAMSLGRVDAFFDIYFERDFEEGTLTESEAQEIIDHIKNVVKNNWVKIAGKYNASKNSIKYMERAFTK